MKLNKLFYSFIFTVLFVVQLFADPPMPPPDPGDGTGGTGPGSQSAPIDMYVIFLAIVAVVFIIHFVRKHQKNIV